MGLFIELYLDEDVSAVVSKMVAGRGFSVLTALEAGTLGKSDEEQLSFAIAKKRTLLTHNRIDFEQLVTKFMKDGKEHAGVIISVRLLLQDITARLLKILNHVAADEIYNQLRYI